MHVKTKILCTRVWTVYRVISYDKHTGWVEYDARESFDNTVRFSYLFMRAVVCRCRLRSARTVCVVSSSSVRETCRLRGNHDRPTANGVDAEWTLSPTGCERSIPRRPGTNEPSISVSMLSNIPARTYLARVFVCFCLPSVYARSHHLLIHTHTYSVFFCLPRFFVRLSLVWAFLMFLCVTKSRRNDNVDADLLTPSASLVFQTYRLTPWCIRRYAEFDLLAMSHNMGGMAPYVT